MRLWLAWRYSGIARDGESDGRGGGDDVAARLCQLFDPLLGKRPRVRVIADGRVGLVSLELPWVGWKQPFLEEDDQTVALSADYPLNARPVLSRHRADTEARPFLPALCRALEQDPSSLLAELSPPFSLAWAAKETEDLTIQNDGLGQSQVFEYEDAHLWAASNKVAAFRALGVPLEPDPAEWAVWSTLGWFPLQMTGYKRIRYLEPGTRLRARPDGIQRTRHDVLGRWVEPQPITPDDSLEWARQSVLDQVRAAMPLWEDPEVALTAGWDSRAVASSLRAAGADFRVTVRGLPGRADVVIASELAAIAGLRLDVQDSGGLPPDDAEGCRRCILRALLWQGGHSAAHRHKTFLARRDRLKLRPPSVSGQFGELARRERALFRDDDAQALRAAGASEAEYEQLALTLLLEDVPPFLRRDLRDLARDTVRRAYRQGERYGLTGLRGVDFFNLHEFIRRRGGAARAWQPRVVVAPFLSPGFIAAVFSHPPRRDGNAFHRYIISRNCPEWMRVPFNDQLQDPAGAPAAAAVEPAADWKRPVGRENYDGPLYWDHVGRPLIDAALAEGGFWTQVLDPDLTRRHWRERPDLLPILHLLPRAIGGTPGGECRREGETRCSSSTPASAPAPSTASG